LDLTNNKFKSLQDERLSKSQQHLSSLLLANNELTTPVFGVLSPLKFLSVLVLPGNPFVCNCQLSLAVDWCRDKGLDTKASCELRRKCPGPPWSMLDTSEICKVKQTEIEVNQNEYDSKTERNAGEQTIAEWNDKSISDDDNYIYVCVTILLCVLVW
jgi:Leucine-rich repeat (LRR) protein